MAAAEASIFEVAESTVALESAESFLGLSKIQLGDSIKDPTVRALLGPVRQSRAVHAFTLRDVMLHAPTMLLFSGDRKLAETRYQVPDDAYDAAHLTDAIAIDAGTSVVIGFNMDWWGYYHWVVQCLPAIDWALRQEATAGVRLALPRLDGWHADLLDLLGYGEVDRIEIDRGRCYSLPHAVYSEHLNGSTAFSISRSAALTFQNLRKHARVSPLPHEIIYLARTDSPRRPMRNEDALIRLLEGEGAAIIVPGQLHVVDQIALFSGARVVIGAHGGALTNIAFCSDGAAVYELMPSHYPNPCFNRLAQARGLDYWVDMFASDGGGLEHQQSWDVDLDVVRRRLAALREAARPPRAVAARQAVRAAPVPPTGELFAFYAGSGHARPIHKWHHYFDIYEKHLARFRNASPTLLELGVEQGGALEMWRAYFGQACRLFGIDADPSAKQYEDVADRVFIGDQRDRAFLRNVLREIGHPDVIVNDGAHNSSQQIAAFEELYFALSEDGVYIVEDTHTALWGSAFQDRADGSSFFSFACFRCAELMGWTGNPAHFETLGTERNAALWRSVSGFCQSTDAISFYDSMIVFERRRRSVPRHEKR